MVLAGRVKDIPTPKSVREAVERGIPLLMVSKVTGDERVLFALEMALADVVASVNVNPGLNIQPHQTRMIAETLLEQFKYESLEDFKLAFARGAAGFYGEIYRLDGAVIVRWIQLYLDEKYVHVENLNDKKNFDLPDVDYQEFQKRLSEERAKQNDNRQAEIDRRRREAGFQMERIANPRQVFLCDGIEVLAVNEHYARMAFKEMFKREPESVTPAEPERQQQ